MKSAGVAELKAHLSEYLASVKQGEEVTVTERGRPVSHQRARLEELARLGLVRLPRRKVTAEEILGRPRPKDPEGLSLKAVLEERESGW
jgi:prevent-host-death family protein